MKADLRPPVTVVRQRDGAIDGLRGLAILLMIGDHVALLIGTGESYRLTLGRVAMPLFFIVSGHLVRRFGVRHVGIAGIGLALPVVVPWIDSPNVLVLYAAGALVLAVCHRLELPVWPLVVIGLTAAANRWEVGASGYEHSAMLALMALGAMLPRPSFRVGARLPAWVAAMGRRPLSWYVGHLIALQCLVLAVLGVS